MDQSQVLALDYLVGDEVRKSLKQNSFDINVKKTLGDQRLAYGIVLRPNRVDAHGDIMRPEEIRKSAHHWMAVKGDIFYQHECKAAVVPVESYLAPADMELDNGSEIKKGDWVMAVKILDDELWEKVRTGEITSFSPGGYGVFTSITP